MLRSRGESGRRWWHAVVLALVLALAVGGVASAGVWGEQTESAPDAVAPPQITIAKETIPAGGGGFEFTLASRGPVLTWGSNGTQPGQFILPTSVTVDGAGNLYVTDAFRIQKFDQRGSFLLQWGSAGSGDGQFNEPDGIAVDSAGNVYVADTFNHRIQKFDSNGVLLTKWGGLGTTDGKFTRPYGVAVSSSGIVYVADTGNNRIQMFDTGGVYQGKWGELGTGDGQFNSPHGIGVDSAGNVYVSERYNHRIQKFDSSGGFLKKWGTQGSGNDQLYQPASLAIDADDDIYVTELQYNRVKKFSNEGAFLAIWQGSGLFSTPYGIATAPGDQFYVADTFNRRIRKFVDASFELDGDQTITYTLDPATFDLSEMVPEHWSLSHVSCNGGQPITTDKGVTLTLQADDDVKCTFVNTADPASLTIAKETDPDGGSGFPFAIRSSLSVLTWGGYGDADGEFSYMGPHGLALDSAGNVYVTDAYHDRIQKFDKNGVFLLTWGTFGYSWHGTGVFYHPRSIAVDSLDKVFVADTNNHRIQVFDTDGNFLTVWGSGPGTGPGEFNFVGDIAFDVNGNIYVADITNHRVQKFDSSLSYVGEWGVSGSGEGEFNNPVGIAVSAEGHVFVVDTGNNRVQKFDTNGNFLGQWGGPGSLPGQFNAPYDVVVNEAGNVYVSDYNNHRLQKFDGDGNLLAVWQGGYYPGMFNFPRGVALDGEGGVYLANANHTVHKLIDLGANIGDDASAQFDLVPGVYSVSELVPDNWSLTGIECNGGNPQRVGDSVNLTLQSADDITCSFTNTADPGRITIVKEVVGQAPAEEWQFTGDLGGFTLPAAGGQTTFDNVPFGQYTINETGIPGYSQSVACDSGETGTESVTVDLPPGDEVTCTFTNTAEPGSITIVKEVVGVVPAEDWQFTGDLGEFMLDAAGGQVTFEPLYAGEYTITETGKPGYSQSVSCTNGESGTNGVTVDLATGQDQICTFINSAEPGRIVVTKAIIGNATGTFTICVNDSCELFEGDGAQHEWGNLTPGDYTVSEHDAGPEWIEPSEQVVTVGLGQTVEVTITNRYESPVTSMCPADDPAVGFLRTELLGVGQGGRTRKLVIPHSEDVASLYGQLAAVDHGIMRYVRFRYPDKTIITVKDPTSYAFHTMAVSWWGSDLRPDTYIKGQFFWGEKGNKAPRAFVLWPTYRSSQLYADVLALFAESSTNHVSWDVWGTWPSRQQQIVGIPTTQADGADVTIQIALVDVNDDLRPVILTVEAGGVSQERVITRPNRKDGLNIELFTLEGVAGGTDAVRITLQSPGISTTYPFGGDSAAIIGAAAGYDCTLP